MIGDFDLNRPLDLIIYLNYTWLLNGISRREYDTFQVWYDHVYNYIITYIDVYDILRLIFLQDNNGTIDKDELRSLFVDMFPNFHRYVTSFLRLC